MPCRLAASAIVLLLVALVGAKSPSGAAVPTDDAALGYVPVMVVMDTSGSMADKTGEGGTTKIEDARRAVLDLVDAISPKQQLGLIAYPGNSSSSGGCAIGEVKIPLGEPDKIKTSLAVRQLRADGDTPTSPALVHAADLLRKSHASHAVIVLVSDGMANCGPPVCDTAKELRGEGIELKVNTVGFDVSNSPEVEKELRCVAKATGGSYANAGNADELRQVLREAASSNLELEATVPTKIPVAVGRAANSGTSVPVTVTNTGQAQASDVRITLDFLDDKRRGGALLVPQPVRFLGNLAPGATRELHIEVRPDGSTSGKSFSWILTATSADGAGNALTGKTQTAGQTEGGLGPVLNVDGPVAIVGDSYSAGEGAGSYLAGTNNEQRPKLCDSVLPSPIPTSKVNCVETVGNKCHRSNNSYGGVLFGAHARIIACSGAVTGDFYGRQQSGGVKVEPQLKVLRELATSKDSPQAVMLTVGGNDVGFGDVIATCFFSSKCWTAPDPLKAFGAGRIVGEGNLMLSRVPEVGNDLLRVYRDVDRAVNDKVALARRHGKIAQIIVLPYVRIIPESGAGTKGCFAGISADELNFLNVFTDVLNGTIRSAVNTLKAEGRPISLAEDVIDAFQPDHTICDGADTYALTMQNNYGVGSVELALARDQQLLHPNAAGYTAIAGAIAGWSRSQALAHAKGQPDWNESTVSRLSWTEWLAAKASGFSVGQVYEMGGDAKVDANGFAATSTVVFYLNSTPRVLGSAVTDRFGWVRGTVAIPADVPRGNHHIRAVGFDGSGARRMVPTDIVVLPQYSALALLLLLIGFVATAVSLLTIRGAAAEPIKSDESKI